MSEKRMKAPEIIAETRWLLDAGVHPLMVAQVLGRSKIALAKMFHRYEEKELALQFDRIYPMAP